MFSSVNQENGFCASKLPSNCQLQVTNTRKVQFSSSCNQVSETTNKSYKLLVVGGGAGGCSTAAKFAAKLGKGNVGIIEPNEMHYYQPLWTLVGGNLKTMDQTRRPMGQVLPKDANWIKTSAASFDPDKCRVTTTKGDVISYEYLVLATGLQLRFDQIKGLKDGLETPYVWSNYHPTYVTKGPKCMEEFAKGNALFTFPKTPVKCPGAAQKIMYLVERNLNKNGKRKGAKIIYHTALPVIFGAPKYADGLWKVVKSRDIEVVLKSNLVEVKAESREGIFQDQETLKITSIPYEILHVTPPMSTPECLRQDKSGLTDANGFVDIDKETLQHMKYPNVFAIGDCSSVPTPKTAAAVAAQLGILRQNLLHVMNGKDISKNRRYDGYTSCPLVIGPGECIMAEFDFSAPPKPKETFPFDQGIPRWSMYNVKAHVLPQLYWQMLRGRWEGPRTLRKIFHLGYAN